MVMVLTYVLHALLEKIFFKIVKQKGQSKFYSWAPRLRLIHDPEYHYGDVL